MPTADGSSSVVFFIHQFLSATYAISINAGNIRNVRIAGITLLLI
jgi:hypothetical protein